VLKTTNYKFGFDIWGLILFLLIMLPNFVWFAVPARNDILRNPSLTPLLDLAASVFQVIMVSALCMIVNKSRQKPVGKTVLFAIIFSIVLYYIGWCLYYSGIVNPAVILILCAAPCLAFILFSASRKNFAALASAIIFSVCHVLFGIVNFIL